MEWRRIWRSGAAALLLAWSVGCGGSEVPPQETVNAADLGTSPPSDVRAPGENRAPTIEALRLEPEEPVSGDLLRAVVAVNEPDRDPVRLGFLWSVGGREVPGNGAELRLADVARGTLIEVVVTASDGEAESESSRAAVTVRNRRPVLTGLVLDPAAEPPRGRPVVAKPEARDPDGDALEFRYVWSVNGRRVEEWKPSLETDQLRKGDRIQVRVWASDGEHESDPIFSHAVTVANAPPEIVSAPSGLGEDGVFRYAVKAQDPDGDRSLRYYVEQGPSGMTVNPVMGEVLWRPTADDAGLHPVKIVVKDSEGLSVFQTFDITIRAEEPEAPPAAMQ